MTGLPVTASSLLSDSEWSTSMLSNRHLGTALRYPPPPVASSANMTTFGLPPSDSLEPRPLPVGTEKISLPASLTGQSYGQSRMQYTSGQGTAAPQFTTATASFMSRPAGISTGPAPVAVATQSAAGPVSSSAAPAGAAAPEEASELPSNKKDLESMNVFELQQLLKERHRVATALEQEVEDLRQYQPSAEEERLSRLEWIVGNADPSAIIKVKSPMLKNIHESLRDQAAKDHHDAVNHMLNSVHEDRHQEEVHLHPDFREQCADPASFVLGRGYVPLDRAAIAKAQWAEERERDRHPCVRDLHYAGHMARKTEEVGVAFVKEGGAVHRTSLWPTAYHGQFWLSLDGHQRNEAAEHQEALRKMSQDAIAQRAFRYDTPGAGEDFYAIDWLGKLKRGDYHEEDHTHPRWSDTAASVAKWLV